MPLCESPSLLILRKMSSLPLKMLPREIHHTEPNAQVLGRLGAGLVAVASAGEQWRVPRFGVLYPQVFLDHMAQAEVAERHDPAALNAERAMDRHFALETLRRVVGSAPLPDNAARALGELLDAFSPRDALVLRVSRVSGETKSAPLFCSDRREVLEGVGTLFANEVQAIYEEQNPKEILEQGFALVIQRALKPQVSGYSLSVAEAGEHSGARVFSTFGLSLEGIPLDRYDVDRDATQSQRVRSRLVQKHAKVSSGEQGMQDSSLAGIEGAPSLKRHEAIEVAELSWKVSAHLKKPVRVGFVFSGSLLNVVSVYELMPEAESGRLRHFLRSALPPAMTRVATPLAFSVARRICERSAVQTLLNFDTKRDALQRLRSTLEGMLAYTESHLSVNEEALRLFVRALPIHALLSQGMQNLGIPASKLDVELPLKSALSLCEKAVDALAPQPLQEVQDTTGRNEDDADDWIDSVEKNEEVLITCTTRALTASCVLYAAQTLLQRLDAEVSVPELKLGVPLPAHNFDDAVTTLLELGALFERKKEWRDLAYKSSSVLSEHVQQAQGPDAEVLQQAEKSILTPTGLLGEAMRLFWPPIERETLRNPALRFSAQFADARSLQQRRQNAAVARQKHRAEFLERVGKSSRWASGAQRKLGERALALLDAAALHVYHAHHELESLLTEHALAFEKLGVLLQRSGLLPEAIDIRHLRFEEIRGWIRGHDALADPALLLQARKPKQGFDEESLPSVISTRGPVRLISEDAQSFLPEGRLVVPGEICGVLGDLTSLHPADVLYVQALTPAILPHCLVSKAVVTHALLDASPEASVLLAHGIPTLVCPGHQKLLSLWAKEGQPIRLEKGFLLKQSESIQEE